MLTASVKVRIVKPVEPHTWDEIGPRLRELAYLAHRVLNGTISRLAMAGELGERAPDAWRSEPHLRRLKKQPTAGEPCPPECVLGAGHKGPCKGEAGGKLGAYPMCREAIAQANAERVKVRPCAWCSGSGVEPSEPPPKQRRTKRQPERAPGEVCSRCEGARERRTGDAVDVPSAIQSGWARLAERRYQNDRRDLLRGAKSLASFRSPAPIVFTSSGQVFRVRHDGRGFVVEVPLFCGGADGLVTLALKPDGRSAVAHMRRIVSGQCKVGDLKILAPKREKQGWLAVISYSWEQPPAETGGPEMVVAMGSTGVELRGPQMPRPRTLHGGEDLRRQRAKFSRRRKSRSKHQRDVAPGSRGHGRARRLQHYHAVDDAEARWLTSVCQQIAAKAARLAVEKGARWVAVDDSVGAWLPPARLRGAVEWALTRQGLSPASPVQAAEESS